MGISLPTTAKGLVQLNEPVDLGWALGPRYAYQGVMPWVRWGKVTGADAAVFHYRGPAERVVGTDDNGEPILGPESAIRSCAHGLVASGLNLWRREYTPKPVVWDGAVGWRFENPASSSRITDASIAAFDIGILLAKSQHTEQMTFENLHFSACRVCFRNEESQACSHTFTGIYQARECEVMFQFADVPNRNGGGGNIDFRNIVMQVPAVMFDIEESNTNSCTFTATNIKIDGASGSQMTGWKLIRHKKGPLNFTARGHIGDKAVPTPDAIDVEDKANCDVQMFWRGGIWPRDFTWNGQEWERN